MQKLEDYFRNKVSKEAYDLFAVFARFEYAMKKGGFRRQVHAEASWRKFAEAMPREFFAKMRDAPEAAIYFNSPPDCLVCDGDTVSWSGRPKVPLNASDIFDCIKMVRNNLFHGDKKHDVRRDRDLVVAALFILNSAYEVAERLDVFRSFCAEMEYGL